MKVPMEEGSVPLDKSMAEDLVEDLVEDLGKDTSSLYDVISAEG